MGMHILEVCILWVCIFYWYAYFRGIHILLVCIFQSIIYIFCPQIIAPQTPRRACNARRGLSYAIICTPLPTLKSAIICTHIDVFYSHFMYTFISTLFFSFYAHLYMPNKKNCGLIYLI